MANSTTATPRFWDQANSIVVNFDSRDAGQLGELAKGGYRYPILEDMAAGRPFVILRAAIPQSPQHVEELRKVLHSDEIVFAYVEKGSIYIALVLGKAADERLLRENGWRIVTSTKAGADKTAKRLKTLARPFRVWGQFKRPLRVFIVEDDAYHAGVLMGWSAADREMLLDGAMVMNSRLIDECIDNAAIPMRNPDEGGTLTQTDLHRTNQFQALVANAPAFNGRVFGQMEFIGLDEDDPFNDCEGGLKGEVFRRDMPEDYEDIDIICARSALKVEVSCNQDSWVLLEPQTAKWEVFSDLQTMVNNQPLFGLEDLKDWIDDWLNAQLNALRADKIMENWYNMRGERFHSDEERIWFPEDVTTLTRWNLRRWLMSGHKVTESPWLFRHLADSIADSLHVDDIRRMRFPIPCAIRCQVVSQSFASMAGTYSDCEWTQGEIRWDKDMEVLIVTDEDWHEMYASHGGCDLDDFFVAFYREVDGVRKVIITRSPNDYGEYTMFNYHEGDWYPTYERADGSIMEFPKASMEGWCKRLSEAVRDGEVTYEGMPSSRDSKARGDGHEYGLHDVWVAIATQGHNNAAVGTNVNGRALYTASEGVKMLRPRAHQLAPMEACIDAPTQGGSAEDVAAVAKEGTDIVEDLLKRGIPLDGWLWRNRFANRFRNVSPALDNNSFLCQADAIRQRAVRLFRLKVRNEVKANPPVISPVLDKLSKRYLRSAEMVLKNNRQRMVRMQPVGEQTLQPGQWDDVYADVRGTLDGFVNPVDKHDFILALWVVSLRIPTRSTDRISDQVVMNPVIFPDLMDALVFYGLANDVRVENNQLVVERHEAWKLTCIECGVIAETDNPVTLQRYYALGSKCKECRS